MSTGFETFITNAERLAEKRTAKLDEAAQKNLEKFKKIYNAVKEAPSDKFSCQIEIEVDSERHSESIILISKFLTETEKWPSNKVNVYTHGKFKIKTDLCLTGVFRNGSD